MAFDSPSNFASVPYSLILCVIQAPQDGATFSNARRWQAVIGSNARKEFPEERDMPTRKHLRGVSKKEQREYGHIKETAQDSGRYGRRAKEVAARTVLKRHRQAGHKKGS
jgi:hypothetical protein